MSETRIAWFLLFGYMKYNLFGYMKYNMPCRIKLKNSKQSGSWRESAAAAKSLQSCPTLYDPIDGESYGCKRISAAIAFALINYFNDHFCFQRLLNHWPPAPTSTFWLPHKQYSSSCRRDLRMWVVLIQLSLERHSQKMQTVLLCSGASGSGRFRNMVGTWQLTKPGPPQLW